MHAEETEHGKWLPDHLFHQDPSLPYILADLMKLVGTGMIGLRNARGHHGGTDAAGLVLRG
jgi:hypothetical protein